MKKIINIIVLLLVGLLVSLPIIFFCITGIAGIQILDGERFIIHIVFVFVCFAGIITSIDNKQLTIEALSALISPKKQQIIKNINNGIVIASVTALFFASFPNIVVVIDPRDSVWGIPVRLIFAALPFMFLGILFTAVKRISFIPAVLGVIIGLFISCSSLSTLFYLFFERESPLLLRCTSIWAQASANCVIPCIGILLVFTLFGLPLFITLSSIAYIAFSQGGGYVDVIPLEMYRILTDTSIAAIPLFTIAGCLLAEGSAGKRLMNVVRSTVGWMRGGAVIATVLVLTFFTTFTGASGVTILALGPLLSLILAGIGYSDDDAEALVTASGSLGVLLPPSLAIIVFGVTNIMTVNMFEVFRGAILPGVLFVISMIAIGIMKNSAERTIAFSLSELKAAFYDSFFELLLPFFIVLLYFSGWFSLLQTAAFTVLYSCVLEIIIRRDFSWKDAARFILKSIPIAGGVLMIIAASKGLAYFLIDANVPDMLTELVQNHIHSKYLFLFLLNILLLLVGCIMDLYSAILVVSPLIMPMAESFGIHPIHTAVIFLSNLTLGFLTPPIGMNLFIASYTFNKPVITIVKNILPYLGIQCLIMLLITYIPWFTLVFLH